MRIHFILIIVCCSLRTLAQDNDNINASIVYRHAFEYIQQDNANLNIAVSDSIIYLNKAWNIESGGCRNEESMLNQYEDNLKCEYSKPYYSAALFNLHEANKHNPQMVLFFSSMENHMLRADLHIFNSQYQYRNELYIWGECIEYLFLLKEDGNIKKVFKQKVLLN